MILYGFAPERKKALENTRFTGFSRASSTFGSRKLHSHATVANLTFAFQARFAKQRCIASNYSSSASFGLDSLSFQPSVLQLFGLHPSLKCNFPSHKLCIFLYFSRFLPRSVPVTLLLSPKFPFWGDQNSHFDNNSPSLPLIGGIRFRIWGKNHPPKIQISNGS